MAHMQCPPFPPVIACDAEGPLYRLPGPQVEPTAGYWASGPCEVPHVVRISELLPLTDDPRNEEFYFEPYPCDPRIVERELEELRDLARRRDDRLPNGEISRYLQLRPQPLGAVFCLERPQRPLKRLAEQCTLGRQDDPPVIETGRELARWFESETPGLGHRHALNCLIRGCDLSPPRQARIWMALDMAIYSALLAAWHYKWASDRPCTVYRPRPFELDRGLSILYDKGVARDGCGDGDPDLFPQPSPGSPRHPAYPSGHSTVGGAASEILKYFFRDATVHAELDKLADNAGMARLWAGIHYRSDHVQGLRLGRSVARLMISQLEGDGVPELTPPAAERPGSEQPAPTKDEVRLAAYAERARCLRPGRPESACVPRPAEEREAGPARRTVQEGARNLRAQ